MSTEPVEIREADRMAAAATDYAIYVDAYYRHASAGNERQAERCAARVLALERIFPEFTRGVIVTPAQIEERHRTSPLDNPPLRSPAHGHG